MLILDIFHYDRSFTFILNKKGLFFFKKKDMIMFVFIIKKCSFYIFFQQSAIRISNASQIQSID